ncbi:MAG: HYExAFE family protein [Phycisphaeraceae bacterium]|nr:HYExAFE family protein [Phycisphaerales bacterium]QOJ16889.1 MAG: HYExAFE family protein [Phycisphaeraceae bacterium]
MTENHAWEVAAGDAGGDNGRVAQRRFHYEQAFEQYLRVNRVPYVAVDEARKALLPLGEGMDALKSFDFVVYGPTCNMLIDVKGRKHDARRRSGLENWVTEEDVAALTRWSELFGPGFEPVFVFAYWCEAQPPDALFEEMFEFGGRWYALRAVPLAAYAGAMRPRSTRWSTVSVPRRCFDRISRSFTVRAPSPVAGRIGPRTLAAAPERTYPV